MPLSTNALLIVLAAAYLAALGWYVRNIFIMGDEASPSKEPEERSSSRARRHKQRRSGKRCPGCGKIVDRRRTSCQYCGHEFELEEGVEPHPDELKGEKFQTLTKKSGAEE